MSLRGGLRCAHSYAKAPTRLQHGPQEATEARRQVCCRSMPSSTRTSGRTSRPRELRDFVADDEQAPKTMLYPRDPSLDPQLVWKGKDEQDRQDLAVPVVPIYIQEKIHPQAIIDDLLARRKSKPASSSSTSSPTSTASTSSTKKVDFYHHDQHWSNRHDPGRLAAGDDQPGREGGAQGQGADDLLRPALRHQVRLELAGQHAQARREGRQGRGR